MSGSCRTGFITVSSVGMGGWGIEGLWSADRIGPISPIGPIGPMYPDFRTPETGPRSPNFRIFAREYSHFQLHEFSTYRRPVSHPVSSPRICRERDRPIGGRAR